MAAPYYRINGIDVLPYLRDEGLIWEENDIDAENSGRAMNGMMYRGLVARKDKHTLKFRKLSMADAQVVLNALNQEYVTVSTNIHPKSGTKTITMYNSSRKTGVYTMSDDNTVKWAFEDMSLIER